MLQHDVSPPSFCCTVNAYLTHLAGGLVVVVNIIGHSDYRTLAAFVFIGVHEGSAIPAVVDTPDALFLSGFAFCSS